MSRVFIEGTKVNYDSLLELKKVKNNNLNLFFITVKNATHFNILTPANAYIAKKIVKSGTKKIEVEEKPIQKIFNRFIMLNNRK